MHSAEPQIEQFLNRKRVPPLDHPDHDPVRTLVRNHALQVRDRAQTGCAVQLPGRVRLVHIADRRQAQFGALHQPRHDFTNHRRRAQKKQPLRSQRLPYRAGEHDAPRRYDEQHQQAAVHHHPLRQNHVPATVTQQGLHQKCDAQDQAKLLDEQSP